MQAVDQRYENLGDGRKACSECTESAVMTTKNCQPLYREILKFYKTNLGMPIEQEVPMLLVKREALNNAQEISDDNVLRTSHSSRLSTNTFCNCTINKLYPQNLLYMLCTHSKWETSVTTC